MQKKLTSFMVKGQSEIWCATYDYSRSAKVGNNEENVVDCMAYYTEMKNDLPISANWMISLLLTQYKQPK